MTDTANILRSIPQVEKLLQNDDIAGYIPVIGRGITVKIIRQEADKLRKNIAEGKTADADSLLPAILRRCGEKRLEKLQKVINGTGIMIHTNLGRSPLSPEALRGLAHELSGYCNLELHLPSQRRGRRGGFAEELICELTGAEDALIVNNNASSVFLILNCLARGKEVLVSRGELVQIGGGFRIPDIMKETGAELVEVGTTNITSLQDFRSAISERTAMIFSAHQSNFRIRGFTESPDLAGLASLKNGRLLVVRDLGSGNLTDAGLPRPAEPTVAWELSQGMDLVCFSGDKLLGGPQAGIIAGSSDLISALRAHPLMRMIRVDKVTYYLLQETLLKYSQDREDQVPLRNIIRNGRKDAPRRLSRLMKKIGHPSKKDLLKKVRSGSAFGGGSMPDVEIESVALRFDIPGARPDDIYSFFIREKTPVVGAVARDSFTIDFSTVLDGDLTDLARSIDSCLRHFCG